MIFIACDENPEGTARREDYLSIFLSSSLNFLEIPIQKTFGNPT